MTTSSEWIVEKTGIHERRFAAHGEGATDMAFHAASQALARSGLESTAIDAILFATNTPDYHAPGCAVLLQHKLNCRQIACFDIRNTSPGFLYALDLADGLMASKRYRTVLVVGSEVHSRMLDFSDTGRLMSVIFGDGAGCVILQSDDSEIKTYDSLLKGNGEYYNKLWCEGPSCLKDFWIDEKLLRNGAFHPHMDGPVVFEAAVTNMTAAAKEILIKNKLGVGDIDWIVTHQANLRIIEAVADNLNIPMHQVPTVIERFGNLSAASIPIVLDELLQHNKIKPGHKILLTSFGAGFCWGAGLIRV